MHPFTAADPGSTLPARPQLKPWYRQTESEDAVILEYGQSAVVLAGRAAGSLLPALLPLLDGTRTMQQIVDELGAVAQPAVVNALRLLAQRDLLLDGDPIGAESEVSPATVTFLASIGRGAARAAISEALAQAHVDVLGHGSCAEHVVALLQQSGVVNAARARWDSAASSTDRPSAPFALVIPSANELPQVSRWNRCAVQARAPWLQVLPFDGRFVAIGPLFVPGETCCYECFRTRRAAASGYAREYRAIDGTPVGAAAPPALDATVAGVAVALATRWLAHRDHYLPGVFYACERSGTALTEHRVYRVPRCTACSGLREAAPPLPWFKEVGTEEVDARQFAEGVRT